MGVDVLASVKNNGEYHPDKVVIITGPTLGSSLKLILFGALLGSAGTFYWLHQQNEAEQLPFEDASQKEKTQQLLQRTRRLAMRAKDLLQAATQNLLPQWQQAVEAAKSTAAETENQLHHDIEEAG